MAIVGTRGYPRLREVEEFVEALPLSAIVISGGARGVDATAAWCARRRGMIVVEIPANFARFHRSAGPIRNQAIVDLSTEVMAFWDGRSAGTRDTITKARRAGVPVTVREARRDDDK